VNLHLESTDGVELNLHDLGGTGAPMLLCHATGFHGLVWRPLAVRLTGYRWWAPDLRGHGDSTPPDDGNFAWSGFADDVLAIVDELGLERPVGVGHSKGGAALLLAEQRRPGTFRALYCYEPVVAPPDIFSGPAENPLAEGALRRRDTFRSRPEAYANYANKPPFDVLSPEALWAYVEHGFADLPDGTVTLKCRPSHEAQVYRMGAQHDAFDHLERITCPVALAHGSLAHIGPAAFVQHIARALPDGHELPFPHLGHFGPLEAPGEVAASVRSFFAEITDR